MSRRWSSSSTATPPGPQSVNPDIRVLSIYNESFTEPAKGASDAAQFIGEGADVIFGAGGPTGSGGVKAAAEAGVWAIGVDQDEYFTTFAGGTAPGAEFLASSAIKRVDLVTFELIADSVQDPFEGGLVVGTAANDLITYAEAHDADSRPRRRGRRGSPSRARRWQRHDGNLWHRRTAPRRRVGLRRRIHRLRTADSGPPAEAGRPGPDRSRACAGATPSDPSTMIYVRPCFTRRADP